MADLLLYFFQKIGEIVNGVFLNLFIIKISGKSIKIMCENYNK